MGTVQTSPCNTACKGLAGLSYLHRAWKQHTVALLQWRWGRSLKPSNCLKQLCRGAENSTVKCRGSSFTVPPLLELAQLAQSCLPLPCWPWIAFFYSVFLLSGHWSPNQARRQHGPICPLCWSITLASSLSSVCSLPACCSCPFPLLLLLASQGQSSIGTMTEAWLNPRDSLLLTLTLLHPAVTYQTVRPDLPVSVSVAGSLFMLCSFNSFHHLLCCLKSTLEEFKFFSP